jgi:hypothetical protein
LEEGRRKWEVGSWKAEGMIEKLENWKIGAIDRRNALVLGWKVER